MTIYEEIEDIPIDHTIQVVCDSIIPTLDDKRREYVMNYRTINQNNTFGAFPPRYLNTARIRIQEVNNQLNWIATAETINGIDINKKDCFSIMIPRSCYGDLIDVAHIYTTIWNQNFYEQYKDVLKYLQRSEPLNT